MDNALAPFIEVRLDWAKRHQWKPARRVQNGVADSNKLWLVRSGSVETSVNNRVYRVRRGMAFLVASHHHRSYVSSDEPCDLLAIGFFSHFARGANLLSSLEEPVLWEPPAQEYSDLEAWLLWLTERGFEPRRGSPMAQTALIAQGLGQAAFGLCWQHLESLNLVNSPRQAMPDWIHRILDYVHAEPNTSVAQWARAAGFSPAQFRRVFGQWVGVSPQEYLARQRLQEARRLLAATDLPVGLISQQLGFSSPSHFTRRFKAQIGASPALYRAALQENAGEVF